MTDIEVKDTGYHTCLTILVGHRGGGNAATIIYLTPKQRTDLIKALQHPTPHQPKDANDN